MSSGILITGGSGLLASNWAVDIRQNYSVTLALHKRRIAMHGVTCSDVSLESVEAIKATIRQAKARVVVHSAAMTNVDACEAAPEAAHHANFFIARNVALACKSEGAKLVHISTDHVFSGANPMMNEDSVINPINVYAQTKAAGEVAVLDICPNAIVVRTNFFGWGLSYRKSFSDIIIEALRGGREMNLFRDAYFTPILIGRLIKASHELIDADASGIFHVVGDERLSKYEFGIRIAKTFGLNASLIKPTLLAERQDIAQRPLDLSLNNNKIRSVIGRSIGEVGSQLVELLVSEGRYSMLRVTR
jgi:dTDP-4-dehydrorhamnose reductase